MQSIRRSPSVVRVVQIDYLCLLACLFPLVFWGAYVVLRITEASGFAGFLYVALAGTVVGAIALAWRYRTIAAVFTGGYEVPAVITSVWFFRGRGRVEYVYTFQNKKYVSGNAVQKTKRTRTLAQGDNVTLMIDTLNPRRAFIRDLYL